MNRILLFNKGIMFLLEICTIISLGYWGFHSQKSTTLSYLLGLGMPLIAAVIWSIWAAPLSGRRLPMPYRGVFAILFFWAAAILLYQSGIKVYAVVFIFLSLISVIVASLLEK